ncbi:MAG: hypothetical protein CL565_04545 [Alphaproteobacteria bacterium]|nr:hypothetical protein [Alphaproteobacteria bacterium]
MKTRPDQLLPEGELAVKSVQSFLKVMGFNPGTIDGDFGNNTMAAYNAARERYDFLPDLGDSFEPSEAQAIFSSIDENLQTNLSFQKDYLNEVGSETNVTASQGSLVAGGAWANRHLGDRISEAEAIEMDGVRGVLTSRGLRNVTSMTGIATIQSSLNLLNGAGLETDGKFGPLTQAAMNEYAAGKGIEITGDAQEDFIAVYSYMQENELDNLREAAVGVLNGDTDYSAVDASTLDAQIVMNSLARQQGLDIRTAPDGLQTDSRITVENSHTRNVIAPATGVQLQAAPPTAPVVAEVDENPYGLADEFIVTRAKIVNEVSDIAARQAASEQAPQNILAYSDEANAYVLVSRSEVTGESTVFQITDTNVAQVMGGLDDGSIVFHPSAHNRIERTLNRDNYRPRDYSPAETRAAFTGDPDSFTTDTKEQYMTTTVRLPDGAINRFQLDDLHDGLDKMDSKNDWRGSSNPEGIRDYVNELKHAVRDVREERGGFEAPEWRGGALDNTNSVVITLEGQEVRMPMEVWNGIEGQMQISESGYRRGHNNSAVVQEQEPGLRREFTPQADPATPSQDVRPVYADSNPALQERQPQPALELNA